MLSLRFYTSMGISVTYLLFMGLFINQMTMIASSGQVPFSWEGDQNMQLKACDLILVGNSKQGILSAYYLIMYRMKYDKVSCCVRHNLQILREVACTFQVFRSS